MDTPPSPRSPTSQFTVDTFSLGQQLTCPNAPRKPSYRREQSSGNYESAVACAREAIEAMSDEERHMALKSLPRHTLEGVFLAFCHWQTGAQPQPFQSLMNHVPNLDQQLLDHVQQALPMLSWDDWNAQAVRAVQDPAAGQQLAEHVMMESAFPGRRLLFC